jgi:hypothetical protein
MARGCDGALEVCHLYCKLQHTWYRDHSVVITTDTGESRAARRGEGDGENALKKNAEGLHGDVKGVEP